MDNAIYTLGFVAVLLLIALGTSLALGFVVVAQWLIIAFIVAFGTAFYLVCIDE